MLCFSPHATRNLLPLQAIAAGKNKESRANAGNKPEDLLMVLVLSEGMQSKSAPIKQLRCLKFNR
jgi:hypothetical protein